jgi:rhodanese-related sulfurtransferase
MGNRYSYLLNKKVKNLKVEEAYELIKNNKDLIILDVRTNKEYLGGHIAKAKSIPLNQLDARIEELEKYKDRPLLVYCASGTRSSYAIKRLLSHKFTNIYHIKRGLRGWSYGLK